MESNGVNAGQLKAIIERLEEEKRALAEDVKCVYAEANSNGFDVKIIRKIVAMRRKDSNVVKEEMEMLSLYADAIGLQLRLL